jgi:hypothetical protein
MVFINPKSYIMQKTIGSVKNLGNHFPVRKAIATIMKMNMKSTIIKNNNNNNNLNVFLLYPKCMLSGENLLEIEAE